MSVLNQQQHCRPTLTEEQETTVVDWVSRERGAGTVVTNDTIRAFANRLLQRDGANITIDQDWVLYFLGRHPDTANMLTIPSHPSHIKFKTEEKVNPITAMMRKDRQRALFGDSPPPPREHAPYPDGEIIYCSNERYVVRHGENLTKYTTSPNGFGARDTPNEALALQFIKAHTTIPVPQMLSSSWDRITMEFVEGQTLQQAWPVLTSDQRVDVLAQLTGYIAQLRNLRGVHIGRLNGEGALVPGIMTRSGGPFNTLAEFHDFLVNPPKRLEAQSMYWHQITTQLSAECPIVFTHGDIAARNIMVRDGRIVALLDWENAGWYPEYWDYVFTIRGMDHIDWETLGQHAPSLFAKRYDLEYILLQFVINLY